MSNISWFNHTDNKIEVVYIKSLNTCTYSVYFKSKKELNYNRFVDLNVRGALRLVHSDLRIYRISFFLLDINEVNIEETTDRTVPYLMEKMVMSIAVMRKKGQMTRMITISLVVTCVEGTVTYTIKLHHKLYN